MQRVDAFEAAERDSTCGYSLPVGGKVHRGAAAGEQVGGYTREVAPEAQEGLPTYGLLRAHAGHHAEEGRGGLGGVPHDVLVAALLCRRHKGVPRL